jgi:signal transduction histidine kinase
MTGGDLSLDDWLALLTEPALVIRATGEIVTANAPFTRLAGSVGEGRPLQEFVVAGDTDLAEHLRMWARNKQPVMGAIRLRTPGGDVDASVHAGRLSGHSVDGLAPLLLLRLRPQRESTEAFRTLTEQVDALSREVSARKHAEMELLVLKGSLEERVATRTAQLRELAGRLIEAEEVERRRLAHALHDNLQQLLVTAGFQCTRLQALSDDPKVLGIEQSLRDLLQESISVSRSLTLDLSPPILYDAGLCAGLVWLGRRTREQHALDVDVRADATAEPEDEQTRIVLFTAARELLFNIVKHANVRSAAIELCPDQGRCIVLRVRDEGAGFDLADVEQHRRGDGFGLFSLRERAELLGGELRIDTGRGRGTTVEMRMPRKQVARGTD